MKLNLSQVNLILQISNNIDITGITNEEIDKLIDFQDGLEASIERTNKKIEKVFQSKKVERTDEAINALPQEKQSDLISRLNEVSLIEIEPLRLFSKQVITDASKQFGVGVIRLSRDIFMK